ncbi:MAG: hypothetical protein AB1673_11485 [Actinomycetota bacterium]|jgi:uncharacterized HAD superfamily protein
MIIGLDLDGVVCDLGPGVARRIADRFGVSSHPDTWRTYDLRLLRLDVPQAPFHAFLDELFADPDLYDCAPVADGAAWGVSRLRQAGWGVVGITARPQPLAEVTRVWLARHGLDLDEVHHTQVGSKSAVAERLGVSVTVEDNPHEADQLAQVCESWLLDRPYNADYRLERARRLRSWDDAVGRLCQLRLFA